MYSCSKRELHSTWLRYGILPELTQLTSTYIILTAGNRVCNSRYIISSAQPSISAIIPHPLTLKHCLSSLNTFCTNPTTSDNLRIGKFFLMTTSSVALQTQFLREIPFKDADLTSKSVIEGKMTKVCFIYRDHRVRIFRRTIIFSLISCWSLFPTVHSWVRQGIWSVSASEQFFIVFPWRRRRTKRSALFRLKSTSRLTRPFSNVPSLLSNKARIAGATRSGHWDDWSSPMLSLGS